MTDRALPRPLVRQRLADVGIGGTAMTAPGAAAACAPAASPARNCRAIRSVDRKTGTS